MAPLPKLEVEYDLGILQNRCHEIAESKGFWEDDRNTMATQLINMIGELSEAWEEVRSGHEPTERYYSDILGNWTLHPVDLVTGRINKPEGVPSELADTVIRVLDTCGEYGINLAEVIAEKLRYNETREHRHGGKVY